jgi:hypothetical protein
MASASEIDSLSTEISQIHSQIASATGIMANQINEMPPSPLQYQLKTSLTAITMATARLTNLSQLNASE